MNTRVRIMAVVAAAAVAAAPASPAAAARSPNSPFESPLSAAARPMWQTDNVVFAMDQRAGVLYAGGSFNTVRPPGSDLGEDQVAQAKLAAFDSATGEFLAGWRPQVNGTVFGVDVSADGSRLYAVGDFTTVDGVGRSRIAAFDLTDPRKPVLLGPSQFAAGASARVYAVEADSNGVFVGGNFMYANDEFRTRVAAFSPADGSLLPFAPVLTRTDSPKPLSVQALAVMPDRVFVGGMFDEVNGVASHGLEAVDPVTGESVPGFDTPPIVAGTTVTTVTAAGGMVYAAGQADKGWTRARLEGVMAMNATTGEVKWGFDRKRCLGDSFAIEVVLDTVWVGTHAHECSKLGGFPEQEPKNYHSVIGHDVETGTLRHFFPDSSGRRDIPGSQYNVRALASDGDQLFVGGGFTWIGERAQQDLARFTAGTPTAAPERSALAVVDRTAGQVTLRWRTTTDTDEGMLTYRVVRQGDGKVIKEKTALSLDWQRRSIKAVDPEPQAGETVTYVVSVSDGDHVLESAPLTFTIE